MSGPLPKLDRIPPEIAAPGDYERFARERVTDPVWAYISSGASAEHTLRDNCRAFAEIKLKTRVLCDLRGGDTRVNLLGQQFDFPILLAPIAYQKLVHPNGELDTVLAASALGAGMVVSTQASVAMEELAREARAPLWFQLYIQPDRDFTLSLVRRAEIAGYRALVVTVDAPVSGLRQREQRAGFRLPPGVEAANLKQAPPSTQSSVPGGRILLGTPLLEAAPTWQDVAWLRANTTLPILLKGVMRAEDAKRAQEEGCDGVVVSNHGGRNLDTQPAAISVLPEVVDAVGADVPVLMDSGVRDGADVFKAISLGARAVLVGRPYLYGLAAAGAVGVSHVLQLLRADLELTMALTGCRNLAAIDASATHAR